MVITIHHNITDPKKWEEATSKIRPMVEEGRLPQGLKAVCYLPAKDGRKADCVWEANSIDDLKRFLDPLTASAARNEYFQINADQAMGLPIGEHAATR